jgi:HD-like signal output (HDOD) protein
MNVMAAAEAMFDAQVEDEYWGLDHAVVGALVLKSWDLPANLVEPVNWHHSPAIAPEYSNESTVVCLADCVAHVVNDSKSIFDGKVESLCSKVELEMDNVMEVAEDLFESDDIEQFVKLLS